MKYRLGVDIGSTTIKAVLLAGEQVVFEDYRRHHADIHIELAKLLGELAQRFGGVQAAVAMTGSAGLGVAEALRTGFVQEVLAETAAVQVIAPQASVIIELGGEDAKITFLGAVPEQRMNGTCAGGTGAFIDQMATLLKTDAAGLDALASQYKTLYPIASRCGVFAKSDLQPLLNDGAAHSDLAASIFGAVATQTIAGLACGRKITGQVVLLGGPLHFLPQLRAAFGRALGDQVSELVAPADAHMAVAYGAALSATNQDESLTGLEAKARRLDLRNGGAGHLAPLFATANDRAAFDRRHAAANVPMVETRHAKGTCFLGIDAGSTTIKAVVIDSMDRIVFSHYAENGGDPIAAAAQIVANARQQLPGQAIIAKSCVTGYGESLIRAALHVDEGEVETMAHYRAAEHLEPAVTSVIDIGGQDMKYLSIKDGVIDSICVNEACSSGCGSFLQTFAKSLNLPLDGFVAAALAAFNPPDLGSRCTVFMNSAVKQAQKEGASVGDISAGLSYAVVRNALYKVIKLRHAGQLGERVVVQGGTFLNDAVLRAFELVTSLEVIRPNIAGLMGAFGAALIAKARFKPGQPSRLLSPVELKQISVATATETCKLCQNHCQCTISTFGDGGRHVSGNRCERGAEPGSPGTTLPNLYATKYSRLFSYRRLTDKAAHRGPIGLPRALNLYENYPLWFTILTKLGFKVITSGRSNHELFETGMDSIASENICYPAKLVHGHIEQLISRGVKTIFYPSVSYERHLVEGADNHYNCPIVTSYPQVISNNIPALRTGSADQVEFIHPFVNLALPDHLAKRVVEIFAKWDVTAEEAQAAVKAGYAEQEAFAADMRQAGEDALDYCRQNGVTALVLAGRPYHVDPEIHHGIPELITSLGMAVLTEDAVAHLGQVERPLRSRDQWAYHSRLYAAAEAVTHLDNVELVQLNSFGCGLDAITTDQVAEILQAHGQVYTVLKIDEVSNLGAARIRLRSLAAAAAERAKRARAEQQANEQSPTGLSATDLPATGQPATEATQAAQDQGEGRVELAGPASDNSYAHRRRLFTKQMKAEHTIIAPQMAPVHFSLLEAAFRRSGYRVEVLHQTTAQDVETGLTHVNNDSCYPAVMVVGQLVNAFKQGRYDPDNTSVLITQTGGMCRATNYTGLLRKALLEAGYTQVPVIALSTQGLESNPGFKLTLPLAHRAIKAIVLGDLLQTLVLRTRPYEATTGAAMALYWQWDATARRHLMAGVGTFRALVEDAVHAFDSLELRGEPRKPRVGIVGEILVKFHPYANNDVVDVVESEACEAVLPGLMEFVLNGMYAAEWNYANLGVGGKSQYFKRWLRRFLERYRTPVRHALERAELDFAGPGDMPTMVREAQTVASLGNQAGEGWLLTAEVLELIESGVRSVICAQPFACLPNHVTGKGMFREIMRRHPEVGIAAIDYDPGASQVNQLNRIKLLLASSALAAEAHGPADISDPRSGGAADRQAAQVGLRTKSPT
ncbi:MAG: acyl-CoA dehydratase activase-related protein [Micrococcales bacterium]|nr:acyl-CoA dehydratase activase-related protein [Micrococcales bacterium]